MNCNAEYLKIYSKFIDHSPPKGSVVLSQMWYKVKYLTAHPLAHYLQRRTQRHWWVALWPVLPIVWIMSMNWRCFVEVMKYVLSLLDSNSSLIARVIIYVRTRHQHFGSIWRFGIDCRFLVEVHTLGQVRFSRFKIVCTPSRRGKILTEFVFTDRSQDFCRGSECGSVKAFSALTEMWRRGVFRVGYSRTRVFELFTILF